LRELEASELFAHLPEELQQRVRAIVASATARPT
jgi:hypothetical protein